MAPSVFFKYSYKKYKHAKYKQKCLPQKILPSPLEAPHDMEDKMKERALDSFSFVVGSLRLI